MGTSKKMTVEQVEITPADAAAMVIAKGLAALVKFNENLIEANAAKDELLARSLTASDQRMADFWKLETERMKQVTETHETLQRLKDREADREERRQDAAAMRAMKEQGYRDVRQLVAVGVNQFAKRPMLRESERGLLTEFLESLSDEQLAAMQTVFRPGQRVAFTNIVKSLRQQEDRENGKPPDPEPEPEPEPEVTKDAHH